MSVIIGKQLKEIVNEVGITLEDLADRVRGRITPRRLSLLLLNHPAQSQEVEILAAAMDVSHDDLIHELAPVEKETRERLLRYLERLGFADDFAVCWSIVRNEISYRTRARQPLGEREFQALLASMLSKRD